VKKNGQIQAHGIRLPETGTEKAAKTSIAA